MPAPIDIDIARAFAVFDAQDSGCRSYGVESGGRRWFVKTAAAPEGRESLTRAVALHAAVRHDAIVAPAHVRDGINGPTLIYPWHDGTVLNHATTAGPDRRALHRFQTLHTEEVRAALAVILDAHRAVEHAGWVPVDLYDGCFLYDFGARRMRLIDLDEYRPGPFTLDSDRLPGSRRYMAPEEFRRGRTIDGRTGVHALGKALWHLLDGPDGWRGTASERTVADIATHPEPDHRYPSMSALATAWQQAQPAG